MTTRQGSSRGVLSTFFTSTRAGATAAAGVGVSLAAFMGVGLAGDYLKLTGQQNLLKAATAAGTVAATQQFAQMSLDGVDDETLKTTLESIAERYLLSNLPPSKREHARTTLELTVVPDRSSKTVTISARADLGGILFLDGLVDTHEFYAHTESGVESGPVSTEVVLALDVTYSMSRTVDGKPPSVRPDFNDYPRGEYPGIKLNIVKESAKELVNLLTTDEVLTVAGSKTAVGLVPWDFRVRLGGDERARWERENWARYPQQRVYPKPYKDAPASGETVKTPPQADQHSWRGCMDPRSATGSPAPAFAPTPPWDSPFTMAYYTHHIAYPGKTIGFACKGTKQTFCYDYANAGPNTRPTAGSYAPQQYCDEETTAHGLDLPGNPSPIVPLTNDAAHLASEIDRLEAKGQSTYSARGVVWALRLLDPTWKRAWGGTVHPLNPATDGKVNKVIVLLTDGEDSLFKDAANHLDTACTVAKNAGVWVFVVAVLNVDADTYAEVETRLARCSSKDVDPKGQYVFVNNNATADALRTSFRSITRQIQAFRITH